MLARSWFAVYVRSQSEIEFAQSLRAHAVEVYLPLAKKRSKPHRKRKGVTISEKPVFTNYVFVSIDCTGGQLNGTEWAIMRTREEFLYVVSEADGNPLIVPEDDIDLIRHLERRGAFDDRTGNIEFVLDDEIEIMSGPFKWRRGKIIQLGDRDAMVDMGKVSVKISVSVLRLFRQKRSTG